MEDRETVSETSPIRLEGEDSRNEHEHDHTDEAVCHRPRSIPTDEQKEKAQSCEKSLLSILKEKKAEDIDEEQILSIIFGASI
ncbi:hypothetical protein PR048_022125 [Dryococelus australis]|uniref:Uncharacterized protein n=1 Tax=Dryococelus australis TaxID=614101 RepID=A0ABQ9H078_9NEOP|nr:hypothetical protein PR048_022125 [Dryococelus australis]